MNSNTLKEWLKNPPTLPEWRPQDTKALKEWRKKNKIGPVALAKVLGVSYTALFLLESGQRLPGGPMLRLLQLLGAWRP